MQKEIDAAQPATPVQILGVNAVGQEAGNATICAGRLLPWLQDTPEQNVWGAWHVTWRDVVILDQENQVLQVYNLTSHNLSQPAFYAELRDILLDAARLVQDFSLTDVNPNSLSHDQPVSPRQQVGKISAWYFGHAT